MSTETIISGALTTVFATIGVALPSILALIAYIAIRLKNVVLTPPAATGGEPSIEAVDVLATVPHFYQHSVVGIIPVGNRSRMTDDRHRSKEVLERLSLSVMAYSAKSQ